jgi:hypothetical protein
MLGQASQPRKRVCLPRRGVPLPPDTRAKIRAALILRPPPAHVEEIIRHYRAMGLKAVGRRVGYDEKVVRRVLEEAGVPIRPMGSWRPGQGTADG